MSVDISRYCFFLCRPLEDGLSGPCVPLTQEEEALAFAPDGFGKDHKLGPKRFAIRKGTPAPTPAPPSGDVPCLDKSPCTWNIAEGYADATRRIYQATMGAADAAAGAR